MSRAVISGITGSEQRDEPKYSLRTNMRNNMATGRLRYFSAAQNGQVNITYVIPNDVPDFITAGNSMAIPDDIGGR